MEAEESAGGQTEVYEAQPSCNAGDSGRRRSVPRRTSLHILVHAAARAGRKTMNAHARRLVVVSLLLAAARIASAQTADDIIEKHLAALGGRAALAKVRSRSMKGTMTLTTPAGDVSGPVEI